MNTLTAGDESLGLTFTDATLRSVENWAREHRPGSRGAHDYDLADYGLTPDGCANSSRTPQHYDATADP